MNCFFQKCFSFLSGKLLPRIGYPILSGPLRGTKFLLGSLSGPGGGARVYLNRIEPEQTNAIVAELSSGDTFFDIGANVGYYSLVASRLVGGQGVVIAIEPSVRNVSYLCRHIEMNHVKNVKVVCAACSNHQGLLPLFRGQNYSEGHIVKRSGEIAGPESTTDFVSVITIDVFTGKSKIVPTVIKIDVEGAELRVLQGAARTLHSAHPKLFISAHSQALTMQCRAFLEATGYETEMLSFAEIFAQHR